MAEEFSFYDPALEQELYEKGKVADCSHARCHSPLGTEVCLRHHLAVMADRVARAERWAEHRLANYRKVEDELSKEREITAGLVAGLNQATDALDAVVKERDDALAKKADEATAHARTCVKLHAAQSERDAALEDARRVREALTEAIEFIARPIDEIENCHTYQLEEAALLNWLRAALTPGATAAATSHEQGE